MHLIHKPNFLGDLESSNIRNMALEETYASSTTVGHPEWFRKSSVHTEWFGTMSYFWEIAGYKIMKLARMIIPDLHFDDNLPTETQLTIMHDGDFFSEHIDEASPEILLPRMTFVYYPGDRQSFTGGDLVVGGIHVPMQDDLLVMYESDNLHYVETVHGSSAQRITINGYSW